MKRPLGLLSAGLILLSLAGCGANRTTLATETVQTYWYDVGHAKLHQAWLLLTPGTQQAVPFATYSSNFLGLLSKAANIHAIVGRAVVNDDRAAVKVTLTALVTKNNLHACQHLFWLNGNWRISDQNGGLSTTC